MTYETMDWEAEAERVRRAFGVTKPCAWKEEILSWANDAALPGDEVEETINMRLELADIGDGQFLHCIYNEEARTFQVYDREVVKGSPFYDMIWVHFDWDGNHNVSAMTSKKRLNLVRALFFLGLLVPAIETALQVVVSAHQKLEWELERERLMNL